MVSFFIYVNITKKIDTLKPEPKDLLETGLRSKLSWLKN